MFEIDVARVDDTHYIATVWLRIGHCRSRIGSYPSCGSSIEAYELANDALAAAMDRLITEQLRMQESHV